MDDRGEVPPRRDWDEFIRDFLTGVRVPVVDTGVFSACQRLKVCDLIKALEKAGKSNIIDAFTPKGLPLGAHRAVDRMHDPVMGFFFAVKEMGLEEAWKKWFRHMASDVVTPRSLPLPGTYLLPTDSWIVQSYAKGLLNFRIGVICPVLGVGMTEAEVRWRLRSTDDKEALHQRLQEAHSKAAAISAIAALMLVLFAEEIAAAAAIAFVASAAWSGSAAGVYWIRRHREEINEKARAGAERIIRAAKKVQQSAVDRMRGLSALESQPEVEGANDAVALPQQVSRTAVGLAAAALVAALLLGPK